MDKIRQAAIFARRVMGNARDYLWLEKYEEPTVEWNSGQQAAELQEAIRQLHEALTDPDSKEHFKSPNELLLDEMWQNCLKINMELTKALQDIARLPEGDEQSAQAVAREVLKEAGVKYEA